MIAFTSLLIGLIQSVAVASTDVPSQCSVDVESEDDNVSKVCLYNEDGDAMLVISRFLGSGELEEERIPLAQGELTKFLAGESLADAKNVKAKNFVRAPSAITK
jgi:hypothetical protein